MVTGPDGVDRLVFHSWSAGHRYRAMNALPVRWTDDRPVLTMP